VRPRPTVRLRLTAAYAGLVVGTTVVLLGVSFWLMRAQLHRTLPGDEARSLSGRLLAQYGIALAGTALLAIAIGWLVAGRVLSPLRRMSDTARRVSEERLDERIALTGPRDELRELGDTLDEMLDRLEAAVDDQRRFVANASHELRSPLTVIRTEADVTLSNPDATVAELREMGEVVLEATDRTEALLDGLLVLARSRRPLRRDEAVDLAVLLRRAAAQVAREAAAGSVELRVRAGAAPVRGDAALLERLAANLAENAVRHNVAGGVAELEAGVAADGSALLRVENSGPVIPDEALARLAQPFERLDRAAPTPGSGLGLSIVRAVAEAHGGGLALTSRPGGGLVAEVRLPAAGPAAAVAGDAVPAPHAGRSLAEAGARRP
jgi:signal transduction histidine kinase